MASSRLSAPDAGTARSLVPSTLLPAPVAILYGLLKRWAVRSASDRHRRVPVARAGMVESRATPSAVVAAVV
ncbi:MULTISPECIES: hypothetical protein [Micromonospora]|uniref:hypothetical protein n=1 Tax=Micromonospora TaxID=1873 RepID=UPI000FE1B04F|nr:hypothetical protein [Micromonospora provocatoris]